MQRPQILTGRIKMFNTTRCFGFITADDGKDYFFHLYDVKDADAYPEKNAQVEFEIGSNKCGPCARNVIIL